jgi:hypothetical protein
MHQLTPTPLIPILFYLLIAITAQANDTVSVNAPSPEQAEALISSLDNMDSGLMFQAIKEASEQLGDLSGAMISLYHMGDYAVLQKSLGESEHEHVICHFHGSSHYHCDPATTELFLGPEFNLIFSKSSQELLDFMDYLGEIDSVPINYWPWVLAGLTSFYLLKKWINYAMTSSAWAPPDHHHAHFLIDPAELPHKMDDIQRGLRQGLHLMGPHFQQRDPQSIEAASTAHLFADLKQVTQSMIQMAVGQSCQHHHDHNHNHHHNHNHNHGSHSHPTAGHNQDHGNGSAHGAHTGRDGHGHHHHHHGHGHQASSGGGHGTGATCSHQSQQAQKDLAEGTHFNFAKKILVDFYREFIRPLRAMGQGAISLAQEPLKRRQLSSHLRVNSRVLYAETNWLVASSLIAGVVGLTAVAEAIESLVVGPMHVACQVGNTIVMTAAVSVYTTYHCTRQLFKPQYIKKWGQGEFWQRVKNSYRARIKSYRVVEGLDNVDLGSDMQNHLLAFRMLTHQLKKLITYKHVQGEMSSIQINQLSRQLGRSQRWLEDVIFQLEQESTDPQNHPQQIVESLSDWFDHFYQLANLTFQWDDHLFTELNRYTASEQRGLMCRSIF